MSTLLTTESKKAWVAGVLAALLQPVLNLLTGSDVLTLRTLLVAVLSGVLAAVAVWATENAEAQPTAAPVAATAPAASVPAAPSGFLQDLQVEATKDFGGQNVEG